MLSLTSLNIIKILGRELVEMEEELEVDVLGLVDMGADAGAAYVLTCSGTRPRQLQWALNSPAAGSWYDRRHSAHRVSKRLHDGASTSSDESAEDSSSEPVVWTRTERELLRFGMEDCGRNIKKLSEIVTTKTEVEIQALIEAEYGIQLETPSHVSEDGNVPNYVLEEIVSDAPSSVLGVMSKVTTGQPTISTITSCKSQSISDTVKRKVLKNKTNASRNTRNSLLKPEVLNNMNNYNKPSVFDTCGVSADVLYFDEDLLVGSTESIEEFDSSIGDRDAMNRTSVNSHPSLSKLDKMKGNHRRKHSLTTSSNSKFAQSKFNISLSLKGSRNKNIQHVLKSPGKSRYLKTSEVAGSSANVASPKLQIILGSGQALPVSEGEQVIKIEKKQDSESDVEIDIESDDQEETARGGGAAETKCAVKPPGDTAAVQRHFEPVRKRQKKILLDGDGGYTIMHTESGDLYEKASEPRREKLAKKQPIHLIHCKHFNTEKPAPYAVRLLVSALLSMDVHAHGSRAEVMGLLGGELRAGALHLRAYRPCAAAAGRTHCDMCPVSQARASEALCTEGHAVVGWHHSHPRFAAQPSALDLRTQRSMQDALERHRAPFVGLITSQHWPRGRTASQYKCLRVESEQEFEDVGYQFSVKLIPDLTAQNVPDFLARLREVAETHGSADNKYCINMMLDVCPEATVTYLEKCISSITHHLTSAGYSIQDPIFKEILRGIRDIFR